MKTLSALALTICLFGCASEVPYLHRFSAGIGQRDVGEDFESADRQTAVAVEYDVRGEAVPLGLELGLIRSSDDGETAGIDFDATTTEAYAGLRYVWNAGPTIRPYLSGGITYLDAEIDFPAGSISDDDFAPDAGAGLDYYLGERWFVGIGIRYVFDSEGDFLGVEGDVDGLSALFKIGYGVWSLGPKPLRQ